MPTVGTGKKKKKFDYTTKGMKQAGEYAASTNQRVDVDRGVYGPTNTSPKMKKKRNTSLRRKKPRPYKTNLGTTNVSYS